MKGFPVTVSRSYTYNASRPPFFYSIEGEAEDVGFKVTMTKILPDPFMFEPLNAQIREWIKSFAHFLINY